MRPELQKGQYVEKRFRASHDDIEVKEDDEGRKRVRMPISSTAEDRDGDEFSQEGLEDERDQINEGKVPAFLDHGRGSRGGYYGALGIVGAWDNGTIEAESHEGESVDVLYADFVPTEANEDASDIVALLEDDMPVGASVGFRIIDYERDRDEGKFIFNSVDLLETSIVGIPSNPLTVNDGADAIGAKALGSPDVPMAFQRGYGGQMQSGQPARGVQGSSHVPAIPRGAQLMQSQTAGLEDIKRYLDESLDDLEQRLADRSGDDSDNNSQTDSEANDMTDPDAGGDNPADDTNNTDGVAELRGVVEEQTDTVDKLANSVSELVDELEGNRDTIGADDPGDTDEEGAEERSLEIIFRDDDVPEGARKEFEALQEKANEDGEIDLTDAKTLDFGDGEEEEESEKDHTPAAENGGLI